MRTNQEKVTRRRHPDAKPLKDFDHDRDYKNYRGWKKIKAELPVRAVDQLVRLEQDYLLHPREDLAIATWHWNATPDGERLRVWNRYRDAMKLAAEGRQVAGMPKGWKYHDVDAA